jgi:hypothetical protein
MRLGGWVAVPLAGAMLAGGLESRAAAQTFEVVGTRALGMGGAFVAVADDATAVYWNPAGLASGDFASLVAEWQIHEAGQGDDTSVGGAASDGSAAFVGLATLPLGLAYYRLRSNVAGPPRPAGDRVSGRQREGHVELRSLVTHHWAATLVQTVVEGLTVAASVKLVRGVAADDVVASGRPLGELTGEAATLEGRGRNTADVDLGALAVLGRVRLGVVARNLLAPSFDTPSGARMGLERQVRAGGALHPSDRVTLAVDADLTRTWSPWGDRRMVAAGGETWWHDRRVAVRAGVRANTLDERRVAAAAGVGVAVASGVFVDARVTLGGEVADRGWGVSARVAF